MKNRIEAIRKARLANGLSLKETEERINTLFKEHLVPNDGFIEESALVLKRFSRAINNMNSANYKAKTKVEGMGYIVDGGFDISHCRSELYINFSENEDGPVLSFRYISLLMPLLGVENLANAMHTHGYANENVFGAVEKLLETLMKNFKKHMDDIEEEMDKLLGTRLNVSRLMKCEKVSQTVIGGKYYDTKDIDTQGDGMRAKIASSCLKAVQPLKENHNRICSTLEIMDDFIHAFGSLPKCGEREVPETVAHFDTIKVFPGNDMFIGASYRRNDDGNCEFRLDMDDDDISFVDEKTRKPLSLENQVKTLVSWDKLKAIQLVRLPDMLSELVERILKNAKEIEEELENFIENYEQNHQIKN